MLVYRCPESRKIVTTGIETNEKVLTRMASFKISVWCPHCQTWHMIAAKDAAVGTSAFALAFLDASAPPQDGQVPAA